MSIINQALKKAQRERFLQHYAAQSQAVHVPPLATRRWPWWFFPVVCVFVLGVGAAVYSWSMVLGPRLLSRTASSAVPDVPPPPPPQAALSGMLPPATTPGGLAAAPELAPPPPVSRPAAPGMLPRLGGIKTALPHDSAPASGMVAWQPFPDVPSTSVSPETGKRDGQMLVLPEKLPGPGTPQVVAAGRAVLPQEQGLPAPPATTSLLEQALKAHRRGENERATKLLEQFIAQDTTSKAAYDTLGSLYYQQKRYQQAIGMYQQALALDPLYVKTRNNLGNTYMQLAMDDEAIEEFQEALRLDSSYGLAYYNLACLHARAGRATEAATYLQQAMTFETEARQWAQTDADFARVRTTPMIRQLLER